MYIPEHFAVTDREEIYAFIAANGFGQLISQVEGRLFVSHLPFLLSADGATLFAHLALRNPQHREIAGQDVLVTLQGEHAYVSPSWYGSAGVPTWNYRAVHIYGRCSTFTDAERLAGLLAALTDKYESALEQPWRPDYRQAMLGAIVGLEIAITGLECKYKLSQNRGADDRERVARRLRELGSGALAAAMERTRGAD